MLPDTSFRSLFLLTGMTTCGCYSRPEDTEMITSVVVQEKRQGTKSREVGGGGIWPRGENRRLMSLGAASQTPERTRRSRNPLLADIVAKLFGVASEDS